VLPVNLVKHTNNLEIPFNKRRKNEHPPSGQVVLLDQYVSSFKGRLSTTKGKEKDHGYPRGGIIYVDHARLHVDMQSSLFERR
jgi:hypothetical protein